MRFTQQEIDDELGKTGIDLSGIKTYSDLTDSLIDWIQRADAVNPEVIHTLAKRLEEKGLVNLPPRLEEVNTSVKSRS